MRQLHSDFAKVNERWGLERGDDIRETGARHRSTAEYREDLRNECTDLEERREGLTSEVHTLESELRQARKRCKGLTTMLRNLEVKEAHLHAEIERLNNSVASSMNESEDFGRLIELMQKRLSEVRGELDDKRAKLAIAERQLQDIEEQIKDAEVEKAASIEELHKARKAVTEQIRLRITDATFGAALAGIRKVLDIMTPEQRAKFDGLFVTALAEHPAEIVKCAMYLFAGYLDGAVQFAQSCGGGGSGSDLPWGRDPKEDDREFAYRCLMRAHRLLKPAPAVKRGLGRH